jgi:hypothetical protein
MSAASAGAHAKAAAIEADATIAAERVFIWSPIIDPRQA